MQRRIVIVITLLCFPSFFAFAQEVFHGCGMEGDARLPGVQEQNRLKNRDQAPGLKDLDPRVTLAAMLDRGDDEDRWDSSRAAEVTGYVHGVKAGGIESVNCHARDALNRDTHIELVLDLEHGEGARRVIVEVTPRWREIMSRQGADWSTKGLRKTFLGRRVKVTGWLFFDVEHKNASENTSPGRTKNWRATAWELHPVTSIAIAPGP